MKKNKIVFSVCLLLPLLLSGCLYDLNDFSARLRCSGEYRDPRFDGWWQEIEQDTDFIICHYDIKKGIKKDYRNGQYDPGSTEYWYTEKNTTGDTSYDGILHTIYSGKSIMEWEHYYRISNDTLKISSEDRRWHSIEDSIDWTILIRTRPVQ